MDSLPSEIIAIIAGYLKPLYSDCLRATCTACSALPHVLDLDTLVLEQPKWILWIRHPDTLRYAVKHSSRSAKTYCKKLGYDKITLFEIELELGIMPKSRNPSLAEKYELVRRYAKHDDAAGIIRMVDRFRIKKSWLVSTCIELKANSAIIALQQNAKFVGALAKYCHLMDISVLKCLNERVITASIQANATISYLERVHSLGRRGTHYVEAAYAVNNIPAVDWLLDHGYDMWGLM